MNEVLLNFKRFTTSHEFKRAVLMVGIMLLSGSVLFYLGFQEYIVGLCLGIFLTAFSDIPGSFRNRTWAMLISIGLNTLVILILNLIVSYPVLLIIFLGLGSFAIALLSVFGNRASMVSLSGLLAIVLGFIRNFSGRELIFYLSAFVLGGLIYVVGSSIYHRLTRKSQRIQRLGELSELTASYFQERLNIQPHDTASSELLLQLQVDINTKQEELRELIFSERIASGESKTRKRHMLILIELIDLMELNVTNNQSYQLFKDIGETNNPFERFAQVLINRLFELGDNLLYMQKVKSQTNFDPYIEQCETFITNYLTEVGLPKGRTLALRMRNYLDYLKKQQSNIVSIERLILNESNQLNLSFDNSNPSQFLTKEDYSFSVLTDNISIKSPMFRHAVRLAIAVLLGYIIGSYLAVQNVYWILLTTVVILRPSYGLTKQRSQRRVLGTFLGLIIAIIVFSITHNTTVIFILMIFSLIFAVASLSSNYILAATAITLNVIFLFSILQPDPWVVMKFRAIDTVIGAVISVAVSYFIFPNWEIATINQSLIDALTSNKNLLLELPKFYLDPKSEETTYRLLRKDAFIHSSEVNSSFQRLTQDPKSKQEHDSEYYELVTLNQELLSTLSNLGSYFRTNHFSNLEKEVNDACELIGKQLALAISLLKNESVLDDQWEILNNTTIEDQLDQEWMRLEDKRNAEIEQGKTMIDPEFRQQLQEFRLIREELDWLESLATNMVQLAKKIDSN